MRLLESGNLKEDCIITTFYESKRFSRFFAKQGCFLRGHVSQKMAVLSIAGLHVTSRRPCWWCVRFKKKAFLSLGTKPNFHANSSRKNSIVLTTNTPPIWPPCHLIVSQECRSIKNIKNIKKIFKKIKNITPNKVTISRTDAKR